LTAASLDSLYLLLKEMVNVVEIDITTAAKVLGIFLEKGCLCE